jgi:hypothetical protein
MALTVIAVAGLTEGSDPCSELAIARRSGAAFALPMMLVSAALVQADDVQTVPTPAPVGQPLNCRECHDSFYTAVDGGQHGLAATLAFQTAWEQQGSPEACLSCHAPAGLQ